VNSIGEFMGLQIWAQFVLSRRIPFFCQKIPFSLILKMRSQGHQVRAVESGVRSDTAWLKVGQKIVLSGKPRPKAQGDKSTYN
jgi:hypothetical protein